jgi:Rieske Fe-S protein
VLRGIIGGIITGISTVMALVSGGAVFAPALARRRAAWIPAARLNEIPEDTPTPVTVRVARQDGYYEAVDHQVILLVKSESGDVRALSSTCTHLGCRVSYDHELKVIKCPCHGGVFSSDGRNVSGPPPAPLATLPTRVDGARVFVQI